MADPERFIYVITCRANADDEQVTTNGLKAFLKRLGRNYDLECLRVDKLTNSEWEKRAAEIDIRKS